MTLIQHYEHAIARGDIQDDYLQRQVLASMERLVQDLEKPRPAWFKWRRKASSRTGIYLYGPVGVGKTYLMDLFYQHNPQRQKARFHFHHFMQQIDSQLRRLQGQKDPIRRIAAQLGKTTRLLCFDEFLVHDVAHAMILAELLQALFAQGIILVATSNIAPDDLYLNGIQRARFLPAIELIKTHCEVLSLGNKRDYRLGREALVTAYLYPLGPTTESILSEQFNAISGKTREAGTLTIQNREVPFLKCSERALWFDFNQICNLPRSQLDYLEIAERFDTVFVSNVPALTAKDTVHAILLIHFVDVMYDRGIRLVISAAVPVEQLYIEGEMSQAFKRTLSRLQEMQSVDYLTRHPRRRVQDLLQG
ncbi:MULTISPECIES: cell division protein ZapE [unclassified Legionella]|uniref:cell division protein ZapE n=1 Tax=unclassified Legionella TaxID=2622702 RepID=UPI001056600F|nr:MULTISPECIES: cell division protein ZapE [unclassified Legionella]MDI9818905.1 cell division protein ZapE [Legionella sp. PL877]